MTITGTDAFGFCERCDAEGKHLIPVLEPDGRTRYVCWECLDRQEKRVNFRPEWQRTHRVHPHTPARATSTHLGN